MLNLLTLLFIALKLTGYIDWSWLVVLSPTIVAIALIVFAIIIAVAFGPHRRRY